MDGILLSRSEALDMLSLLEEAASQVLASRVFALVVRLQDGIEFLVAKLFPDLPEAPA